MIDLNLGERKKLKRLGAEPAFLIQYNLISITDPNSGSHKVCLCCLGAVKEPTKSLWESACVPRNLSSELRGHPRDYKSPPRVAQGAH